MVGSPVPTGSDPRALVPVSWSLGENIDELPQPVTKQALDSTQSTGGFPWVSWPERPSAKAHTATAGAVIRFPWGVSSPGSAVAFCKRSHPVALEACGLLLPKVTLPCRPSLVLL